MDSATVTFVLFILMQPVFVIAGIKITEYRIENCLDIHDIKKQRFEEFCISARKHLETGDLRIEMLKIMNKYTEKNKNQLVIVMQAYYCSDVLADYELALLKIETAKFGFDFSTNFHIYKCRENLQKINKKLSESLKLCLFLDQFCITKSKDAELCESLKFLFKMILDPSKSLPELKKNIMSSCLLIKETQKNYSKLFKIAPNSKMVLELYGSFLLDIMQDREKGTKLINREHDVSMRCKTLKKKFKNYINENPIFITSGNEENFGKIIYANTKALDILEQTEESILDCNLFHFVPDVFQKLHKFHLKYFINHCTSTLIVCNAFNFLNVNGFLVECNLNIECVAYNGLINFVCVLEYLCTNHRQTVLIDSKGMILLHSKNFPKLFGIDAASVQGDILSQYLTTVDYTALSTYKVHKVSINTHESGFKALGIYIESIEIHKKAFFVVYLTANRHEINTWFMRGFEKDETNDFSFSTS